MPDFGPDVQLDQVAFIHPSVLIYGNVTIGKGSSVWPRVVMRAESYEVTIGERTNIQDFAMVHVGDRTPTHIGDNCSITHHCTIHGCTIGDNCLIGINATIMDGCVVGQNSIIGGGTFLKEGTIVPENSIAVGVPGKVIRKQNNWLENRYNAYMYHRNALCYARGEHRGWTGPQFEQEARAELVRLQTEYELLYSTAQD